MKSPLSVIKDWYLSLPIDQRVDISVIVGMMCPGFEEIEVGIETEKMTEIFLEKIESCFSTKPKEIGMTLALSSVIEFFFINKRSDPNTWKESEQMLLDLAEVKKSNTFKRMAGKIEFKAKQWIVSCKKWDKIKSDYLNDTYLNNYANEILK